MNEIVAMPDTAEKLAGLGAIPHALGPREFATFLDKEDGRWSEIVKSAGVTVE